MGFYNRAPFKGFVSSHGSSHRDVLTRVAKTRKHFNSLHQFWRNTDLTLKWKLRIYNAVFIPLVTYGLESAALTKGDFDRLEAFHSQSLWKILLQEHILHRGA